MSTTANRGTIVLLAFENKRLTDFDKLQCVAAKLATFGYYCDKVSRVAFDSQTEIINALKDGVGNYENVILYCPEKMGKMLADYVSDAVGGRFDNIGILECGRLNVFLLFSDTE
ncbi:MAG: hypothetical protein K2J54_05850, partial [Clostridia bacterium]|nr:hypothetical protein [Clostridia bacterium]